MQCSSLLYTKPPEGGERLVLPLHALAQGYQVALADIGIIWVFVRVGQCHEDHPPFECPEGASVDASQTPEEVPTACPGEAPYPISAASATTHRRTTVISGCAVLEGECGYRPSYGGGDIGNPLESSA